MDYKDLADLIFPDAKPIKYYEEKYPERNLPEGAMVVRIGPSPTGSVHIGTIYQALIATMLAKRTNGVFFMRVEDTDQKREVKDGIKDIIESLKYFELMPNEGMKTETEWYGEYGPYRQSMRAKQEAAGVRPGYYGVWAKCRNITVEEAVEKIKNGEKYIIRFKSPGREDKKIKHKDVIKGNVEMPENDQDIVIIKADGLPTYHFAHVVDDHLMHTTHVTRGDEWLSSVPVHLQLFQELGFKPPRYAHTATILKNDNGNKRKISKRKDPEASAGYYREIGIPVNAVKEYLLNIANSTFENWRKANPDKAMEEFDFQLNKMSVSGALFDMVKLLDIGKNVISKMTAQEVYDSSLVWAKEFDKELEELLNNKEYSLKVLGIERGKAKPRRDISKWSDVKNCIEYMYDDKFFANTDEYEFDKINDKEEIKKILDLYLEKYFDLSDDQTTWFGKIKDLAEELGYAREVKEYKQNPENWPGHVGDISTVLRVALTKRRNTPDLYEIMQVLGKDSVEKRLKLVK